MPPNCLPVYYCAFIAWILYAAAALFLMWSAVNGDITWGGCKNLQLEVVGVYENFTIHNTTAGTNFAKAFRDARPRLHHFKRPIPITISPLNAGRTSIEEGVSQDLPVRRNPSDPRSVSLLSNGRGRKLERAEADNSSTSSPVSHPTSAKTQSKTLVALTANNSNTSTNYTFFPSLFLGRWFEVLRTRSALEVGRRCTKLHYAPFLNPAEESATTVHWLNPCEIHIPWDKRNVDICFPGASSYPDDKGMSIQRSGTPAEVFATESSEHAERLSLQAVADRLRMRHSSSSSDYLLHRKFVEFRNSTPVLSTDSGYEGDFDGSGNLARLKYNTASFNTNSLIKEKSALLKSKIQSRPDSYAYKTLGSLGHDGPAIKQIHFPWTIPLLGDVLAEIVWTLESIIHRWKVKVGKRISDEREKFLHYYSSLNTNFSERDTGFDNFDDSGTLLPTLTSDVASFDDGLISEQESDRRILATFLKQEEGNYDVTSSNSSSSSFGETLLILNLNPTQLLTRTLPESCINMYNFALTSVSNFFHGFFSLAQFFLHLLLSPLRILHHWFSMLFKRALGPSGVRTLRHLKSKFHKLVGDNWRRGSKFLEGLFPPKPFAQQIRSAWSGPFVDKLAESLRDSFWGLGDSQHHFEDIDTNINDLSIMSSDFDYAEPDPRSPNSDLDPRIIRTNDADDQVVAGHKFHIKMIEYREPLPSFGLQGGYQTHEGVIQCLPHGRCQVILSWVPYPYSHQVVRTDYTSTATIYSCFSIGGFLKMEYAWVLHRDFEVDKANYGSWEQGRNAEARGKNGYAYQSNNHANVTEERAFLEEVLGFGRMEVGEISQVKQECPPD